MKIPLIYNLRSLKQRPVSTAATALGMGLTAVIRVLLGLPAWKAEPLTVVGAIVGGIAFLIGVGAVTDWFKWARGQETPLHHGPPADKPACSRPSPSRTGALPTR